MVLGVRLRIDSLDRTFAGAVVASSLGRHRDGFVLSFAEDAAPPLAPGADVAFTVIDEAEREESRFQGVVSEAWDESGARRLLVQCPAGEPAEGGGDRRGALRLALAGEGVRAAVTGLDGSWRMTPVVDDVSETGISFLVPEGQEFSDVDSVVLIEIDVAGESLTLAGRIRYRRPAPPHDVYGVEFDPRFTRELARKQLAMRAYVAKRSCRSGGPGA